MFACGADKLMNQNKGVFQDLLTKVNNEEVITSVEKGWLMPVEVLILETFQNYFLNVSTCHQFI